MRDDRIFGVNPRGNGRWCAWTCFADGKGGVVPGSFQELSTHDTEQEAHDAANAAREKHLSAPAA